MTYPHVLYGIFECTYKADYVTGMNMGALMIEAIAVIVQ